LIIKEVVMTSTRIYALDWLRVIAFFLLMLYHTGMIFVGWDFHVQSPDLLNELAPLMIFLNQWRLPLLFAISGAGTMFALKNRTPGGFAKERTVRLFIPLVFGMFFIVPPQIYVEYVLAGNQYSSYLAFQATVFQLESYPGGAFSWHHLWFVLYLFVISMLSLPLLFALRTQKGQTRLERWCTAIASRTIWLMAPAAILTGIYWQLDLNYPENHSLFEDPGALIRYATFFWLGLVFFGSQTIREKVREHRARLLITMAIAFVCQRSLIAHRDAFDIATLYLIYFPLKGIYAWGMILTLFGYAQQYLNFNHAFLRYTNEAVYPFYILHQSVMMVVFYWTLSIPMSPWLRFVIILVSMFLITWTIYEAFIRGSHILRPLFGMRIHTKAKSTRSSLNRSLDLAL
jgi:peptidoglycan/LPS O-acetylase OafA/YrhL